MGKRNPLGLVIGVLLLVALLFGVWQGVGWVASLLVPFSPLKLAVASVLLTAVPALIVLLVSAAGGSGATSTPAWLSVFFLPISALGLLVSAIWYVVAWLW